MDLFGYLHAFPVELKVIRHMNALVRKEWLDSIRTRGGEKQPQVRRVVTPSQNDRPILEGKVGIVVCPIFIDSGADISMI